MAIRLRKVNGIGVALCAYETDEKEGDVYIDDGWHYALAAKFRKDWNGGVEVEYPKEWGLMETQKVRDAATRDDL